MSDCYLVRNPPSRSQFRPVRRAKPSGVVCLHTAESMLDAIGNDTGAEGVAAFICRRTDPGSYHDLVDSDSAIQLVPYDAEAYQDGTGTNPHALSISWAIRAVDWPRLTPARRDALLMQGAGAFARQQAWLEARGYPTTPLRRISRERSSRGEPGFVTHGDRDPGRRSDPGAAFPWQGWFAACRVALGRTAPTPVVTPEEPDMRLVYAGPTRATCLLLGTGQLAPLRDNDEVRALEAVGVERYDVTPEQWDRLDAVSKRLTRP